MLEVQFFGSFAIQHDGKPIVLSSRAAQSLFAYLILTAGTQHRREKLAGLFWPDLSEAKARTYLRQQLWRIRKALPAKTESDYLLADDITICFNAASEYRLDVAALRELEEDAPVHEMMMALSMYQGELLPGFYEDWVSQEREHLQVVFETRMEKLLELLAAEKRWQDLLEWAERWIQRSAVPETAYRQMIAAYNALGDRARAASTYERCVKALRELDLEPSEETRTLVLRQKTPWHVPLPLTSFIGRAMELEEIASLLRKSRLVTLTGSAGIGKTRLAIQVAEGFLDRFSDGIWFLDLAPLRNPNFVPNRLANLLGLLESGDPNRSVTDLLTHYFGFRSALIIFDNCEHLIASCAQLASELLTSCEHLSILATSREALRISGEIPYRVPSLDVPQQSAGDRLEVLQGASSIRLFGERAAVISPGFVIDADNAFAIAQICRRLDGIPLAIELAAARTNVLTVNQISSRLDDRFQLLSHGLRAAPPRHETLRATIEWSYQLLSEQESTLFRQLAIFVGGGTLDAVETVCSVPEIPSLELLNLLSSLVNKSLVMAETVDRGMRYHMLETIRQFGLENLFEDQGEAVKVQERQLKYFLRLAEEAEPHLLGVDQSAWMDILEVEFDNIRLALDWAISQGKGEDALRLYGALGWFLFIRCRFREGEQWFKRANLLRESASTRTKAIALRSASWLYYAKDDFSTCLQLHRESLDLFLELKDEREVSTTLQFMGVMEFTLGNTDRAKVLFDESLLLSRRLNNRQAMPRVLMHLGHIFNGQGNLESARIYYEESLAVAREVGEGHLLMMVLGNMGQFMQRLGSNAKAREYYQESLQIGIRLKNKRTVALTLLNFAELLNAEEKYVESARLQGFAESLFNETEVLTKSHVAAIEKAAGIPRAHLGEETYLHEYGAGRSLGLEQAVAITAGQGL